MASLQYSVAPENEQTSEAKRMLGESAFRGSITLGDSASHEVTAAVAGVTAPLPEAGDGVLSARLARI